MESRERRKSRRKRVAGAIVAVRRGNLPEVVARVGDVSPLGLSFFHDGSEGCMRGQVDLDILFLQENIFWQHVPCSVVADTSRVADRSADGRYKRRYSVKFDMLTSEQELWLRGFAGAVSEHDQLVHAWEPGSPPWRLPASGE